MMSCTLCPKICRSASAPSGNMLMCWQPTEQHADTDTHTHGLINTPLRHPDAKCPGCPPSVQGCRCQEAFVVHVCRGRTPGQWTLGPGPLALWRWRCPWSTRCATSSRQRPPRGSCSARPGASTCGGAAAQEGHACQMQLLSRARHADMHLVTTLVGTRHSRARAEPLPCVSLQSLPDPGGHLNTAPLPGSSACSGAETAAPQHLQHLSWPSHGSC